MPRSIVQLKLGDRLYVLSQLERAQRLADHLGSFIECLDVDELRNAKKIMKEISEGDILHGTGSFIDVIINELKQGENTKCPEEA